MERSIFLKILGVHRAWEHELIAAVLAAALLSTSHAYGDVLLAPHTGPSAEAQNSEYFNDSRFGMSPSRQMIRESVDPPRDEEGGVDRRLAGVAAGPKEGLGNATPEQSTRTILPRPLNPKDYSRTGVQEVALIASDLGYFPKAIFVTRDIPVRLFITGAAKKPLCFMMDAFEIRKQVRTQKIEEIQFTPNIPGQFRFYCPVNGIEGTLLVKELVGITEKKIGD